MALIAFLLAAVLCACGGSTPSATATPSPTAAALATPSPTPAPRGCPTAAKVGSALGVTLPKPVGVPYSGSATLPAGAKVEVCEYHASTYNVIIEVITNIDPTYISKFSDKFPVAYATVPGVGDQARSFLQSLGSGKDNEGVVATKGMTLVAIVATATPASLAQLEALVSQLL